MASLVFNVARGRTRTFTDNAAAVVGGARIGVLLLKTGVVADGTMSDYATVAAVLAANPECNRASYGRRYLTAANITSIVSNASDKWDGATTDNVDWGALETGDTLVKAVWFYDSTGSQVDSGLIPMVHSDVTIITDGTTPRFITPNFVEAKNPS